MKKGGSNVEAINIPAERLSKAEMMSILEHLRSDSQYPVMREVAAKALTFFDRHCPGCGVKFRRRSRIVRVFEEGDEFDIVTYICRSCGTVFRKYEDKRGGNVVQLYPERKGDVQ
jgi:hypothetical protein